MSFTVIIQKNTSENIKLDKSLTIIATLTGVLKEASSLINPSILVEASLSDLKEANYLTIQEFGRSYFIQDITSIRNDLIELTCHVDVLSSFKSQIRANKGIVFRQEKNWNLFLNDGVLEIYQNPIVVTKEFPNGFDAQSESYVLALAGRRGVVSTSQSGGGGTVIPGPGITIGAGGGIFSGSGDGSKSCVGLAEYALAHLNCPYWWGTFGNIASQSLLDAKIYQYPDFKQHSGGTSRDYTLDFGQQVFDCVGLIKGYRWSASMTADPTSGYVASQDVNVAGLFGQASITKGAVGDSLWNTTYSIYKGICLFWGDMSHVGVSMGDGTAIECTTYNGYNRVVRTNIADRNWTYWAMPDWMIDNVGTPFT